MFWSQSLKMLCGFSSAAFHPLKELCVSRFQLEHVPGERQSLWAQEGKMFFFAQGKGLPKCRCCNLGKHEVGVPKAGVLFSSTSGSSWLYTSFCDECISHPTCTAVGKPVLEKPSGFTSISGLSRHHVGEMNPALTLALWKLGTQPRQLTKDLSQK